jgi:hypothetical protein
MSIALRDKIDKNFEEKITSKVGDSTSKVGEEVEYRIAAQAKVTTTTELVKDARQILSKAKGIPFDIRALNSVVDRLETAEANAVLNRAMELKYKTQLERVKPYLMHRDSCVWDVQDDPWGCTCGLQSELEVKL